MFNIDFSLEYLIATIISIVAFLISIAFHEFAHGFVAYKLGDKTAKAAGRLTLNPIKHFDLFSMLFFVLFRFGWAKGVPVNSNNFKDKKKGLVMTSLAGPLTNVLLAFIAAVIIQFFPNTVSFGDWRYYTLLYLYRFLWQLLSVNAMLAIFNLIPIPPLDGSKVFFAVLPDRTYYKVLSYDHLMLIVLLVLVYSGLLDEIIFTGTNNLINVITNLADKVVFF